MPVKTAQKNSQAHNCEDSQNSDYFAQKTDGSSKLRQRLGDEGWQENLRLQRT